MTGTSTEKIVFTEAADGLPLEGVIVRPAVEAATAIVLVHGGTSRFCEPHYLTLARELAGRGYVVVCGNTRGHDGFALTIRGKTVWIHGASFEVFDEAPLDIEAWITVAAEHGAARVILAGHSLGGSKVAIYQAQRMDQRVVGLVAISPPDQVPGSPERLAVALDLVESGRDHDLMPAIPGAPAWNIVSARTVVSRSRVLKHVFASTERSPDVASVRCPFLLTYGGDEEIDPAWPETVRSNATAAASFEFVRIDGAEHDYVGREPELAQVIDRWFGAVDQ